MLKSLLVTLLFTLSFAANAELVNQLRQHPSPYLALHGEDPVAWQIWGEETLDRAREGNKLLFISSGYFSCHWCHVMQRESYKNPEIAALLNQYFIPVKLDRELHPALDAHLIEFVRRTRGTAGWPLNVFLTPEGYPLVGSTYQTPEAFLKLLQNLQKLWQERPDKLGEMARAAAKAMAPEPGVTAVTALDAKQLHARLVAAAITLGDDLEGGFGSQNRFPMAPQWQVLLERFGSEPDTTLGHLIELTLDQMAGKGLRDHIGGGFFRYTVDPGWQVPHFEKMLYTQALLIRLYLNAAKVLQRPDYLAVARDTLDFTLAELRVSDGGFISSLSAVDVDDREGGGYLWTQTQLEKALNQEELEFARERWRLYGSNAIEGGWLPVKAITLVELAAKLDVGVAQLKTMERQITGKLLQARRVRSHPRDGKQLAAWNGLMLSALVDAARELQDQTYRDAAGQLRDFLVNRLWDGEQLLRARGPGGELGSASLEDYAYVAAALSEWADLTGSETDRLLSKQLLTQAWRRFFRADQGWLSGDDLLLPGVAAEWAISDAPLPSPAAVLIGLTLNSEDPDLRQLRQRALQGGYPQASEQPVWYATQAAVSIRAAELARQPTE